MDTAKFDVLTDLESEFETVQPTAAPVRRTPTRKVKAARMLGAVFAMAAPLLFVNPAPAAASCDTALSPSAVSYSHTKYCSLGTYGYTYTGATVYYSARTTCYHFNAYAFMCGLTSRYDRGAMTACKTY
ncbi:hypothetical protein COUCH_32860 [Couchioplanes caeruleus]|uniref:hypothetical protein n=1 Tax=Couchioplanes caeruleus TaxID=56438 RepID=UPI0020C10598|nr:hypothetical protein [Couchioplanes caeruleus]UQU63733.1 hypothetical protein COUCH_32860 [Couchioplanes caeruleus]